MKLIVWSILGLVYSDKLKIIVHSSASSRSHAKPLLEIGQDLVNLNHEVTFAVLEDSVQLVQDYKNIAGLSLGNSGIFNGFANKVENLLQGKYGIDSHYMVPKIMSLSLQVSYPAEINTLNQVIETVHPDVIVCDYFAMACRDLAELNSIPLVISMQTIDWLMVAPVSYITKQIGYGPLTTNKFYFLEKWWDYIISYRQSQIFWKSYHFTLQQLRSQQKIKLTKSIQSFHYGIGLANTYFGFEIPQTLPPNIQFIGPLLSNSIKIHSTDNINQFLNFHKRILYIGFGSQINLELKFIKLFLQSGFELINNNELDGIIWGLGRTSRNSIPDSILIENNLTITFKNHPKLLILKWAPQPVILQHNNTKLFLSHGGLESLFEAIHAKTAVLCMPYIGDQFRNAAKVEAMGIGQYMNSMTITQKILYNSIYKILRDENQLIANNLERMSVISHYQAKLRYRASNTIIETANIAKTCRISNPHQIHNQPCELHHLFPPIESTNYQFLLSIVGSLILITSSYFFYYPLLRSFYTLTSK